MAPLRISTFRRLWGALIVFNLGHLIQVVASSWMILELTSSPLWVSVMVAAPTLPLLLLSLPAGAAADLFDRRIILVTSSAVLAVASLGMSALSALDQVTPGRLVGLGLAIGVGVAFFNPALQAIVPSLVPPSLVPGAVSLNSATGGAATALGPAVGGFLVATVGPGWAFAVATIGYSGLLVTMLVSRTSEWNRERGSMVIAIATGIRYLRFSRDYLWLLLLGSMFGFASAALRSMLPNLTSDVLGGDSALYGILLGLFGGGALVGGLTRSVAAKVFGRKLIPECIILFGAAGAVVSLSTVLPITAVGVTIAGLMWTWILSTLNSTYQMLTPNWVRGRTMSAFVLSVFGFLPLGAITAGALGDSVGAGRSLLVFSTLVVATGVTALRMPLPVLEQIEPPIVPDPEAEQVTDGDTRSEAVMVTNTWTIEEHDFNEFVDFLSELRRLRLRTGAFDWTAYRSATDLRLISEVFMLHSWEQHLLQHRRLDLDDLQIIREMESFGDPDALVREHLVAFDVDHPRRRPAWSAAPRGTRANAPPSHRAHRGLRAASTRAVAHQVSSTASPAAASFSSSMTELGTSIPVRSDSLNLRCSGSPGTMTSSNPSAGGHDRTAASTVSVAALNLATEPRDPGSISIRSSPLCISPSGRSSAAAPMSAPAISSTAKASAYPLWPPKGRMAPPSVNACGSRVGRPSRSTRYSPSRSTPRASADATLPYATADVAKSREKMRSAAGMAIANGLVPHIAWLPPKGTTFPCAPVGTPPTHANVMRPARAPCSV